jgi:hypothetical protein
MDLAWIFRVMPLKWIGVYENNIKSRVKGDISMSLRFCFAGFRHGHIFDVLNRVQDCPDTEFAGA